jgi:hypothetical protein
MPLREYVDAMLLRESMAAECRARHQGLAEWAKGVSR